MLIFDETLFDPVLIHLLDEMIESSTIIPFRIDPGVSQDDARQRVSDKVLREIQKSGDRFRSLEDTNKSKLCFSEHLSNRMIARVSSFYREHHGDFESLQFSGGGLYPKCGYMGWHTNSCTPGVRLYFSKVLCGSAHFGFEDENGAIQKLSDESFWKVRAFDINSEKRFWHYVYSEGDRYSLGFRIVANKSYKI